MRLLIDILNTPIGPTFRLPLWQCWLLTIFGGLFMLFAQAFMELAMHYYYPTDTFEWPFFAGWMFSFMLNMGIMSRMLRNRKES